MCWEWGNPAPAPTHPSKNQKLRSADSATDVKKAIRAQTKRPVPGRTHRRAAKQRPKTLFEKNEVRRSLKQDDLKPRTPARTKNYPRTCRCRTQYTYLNTPLHKATFPAPKVSRICRDGIQRIHTRIMLLREKRGFRLLSVFALLHFNWSSLLT